MIDWLKELAWAIAHDEDTKILLSVAIACLSIGMSVVVLVLKATGR